ncbi:MAG: ATP-binding cassette domain-containing protein [Spirochaetes bacterium]|jgi:phospholipid/cholesterol/gamma-HCH transport system ATP-binding protein|nr:ATP-binding cassette domain-containing protein [Spirochaetota bacterium]
MHSNTSGNPKVELKNLYKSFGEKKILQGINLSIEEGEILCVIGQSGSGKSVILKNIIGLMHPDDGSIFVDGKEFTGTTGADFYNIQHKFGVLFQMAALFDSMNIFDNVAFAMRRKKIEDKQIKERVPELLAQVGLRDIEQKMPSELSGGMQKRVGLARALAMKPEIMLYDEPTTGVDPITGSAVDRLIVKMNNDFNITSVVITHDLQSAFRIADRIAMLHEGDFIFLGTPDEFNRSDDDVIIRFIAGRASS